MKPAYSVLVHLWGGTKYYSYLPPHGLELKPFQSITYVGEFNDRLISSWGYVDKAELKNRKPNRTKLAAIANAEKEGLIKITRFSAPQRNQQLTKEFYKLDSLGMKDPNHA